MLTYHNWRPPFISRYRIDNPPTLKSQVQSGWPLVKILTTLPRDKLWTLLLCMYKAYCVWCLGFRATPCIWICLKCVTMQPIWSTCAPSVLQFVEKLIPLQSRDYHIKWSVCLLKSLTIYKKPLCNFNLICILVKYTRHLMQEHVTLGLLDFWLCALQRTYHENKFANKHLRFVSYKIYFKNCSYDYPLIKEY